MTKIRCVIFDWAGTTVDYGCFAPVRAFLAAFAERGVALSARQVREPMGLPKRDHLRALLRLPEAGRVFGAATAEVEEALYGRFEALLFAELSRRAEPLPGVVEVVAELRRRGVRIGSTTGYTRAMMETVAPAAAARGYAPDCLVTPDDVAAGRPAPDMIRRNLSLLGIVSPREAVKVGDTPADMREGVAAGVWSVGVVAGGNELGITVEEAASMPAAELARRHAQVHERLMEAGADAVIGTMSELPRLIDALETRGEIPINGYFPTGRKDLLL